MLSSLLGYWYLALVVVAGITVGYWVYSDAVARGRSTALARGVESALLLPLGAYYLVSQRWFHDRERPPTKGERTALLVAVSGLTATIGAATVAPPDPITQGVYSIGIFVMVLPVTYALTSRIDEQVSSEG